MTAGRLWLALLEKDEQVRLTANDAVSSAWLRMDDTGEASDVERDFVQFQIVDSSLSEQLVYGEADPKPGVSITGADLSTASDSFQRFAFTSSATWAPNSNLANLVIYGVFIKNQHFVT